MLTIEERSEARLWNEHIERIKDVFGKELREMNLGWSRSGKEIVTKVWSKNKFLKTYYDNKQIKHNF